MKYKILFFLVTYLIFSFEGIATADCNFVSGKHSNDLSIPNKINFINIEIPKSGKFNKNFAKIIVSKSKNIPPKLKKKFKANITIKYSFGKCVYEAIVKQSGDWKDHVDFTIGGKPLRSLLVKLKEGNILNAIKFKLFLPETRNNLHEILGTVLMRKLGFIAPETFQVKTIINGVESVMLFQEHASKEMLERNKRREGPIFEGDESLLWSFKNYKNFTLEPISLARMINKNWFLKGKSSQHISLYSYRKIQRAFLDYSQNMSSRKQIIIFPNGENSIIFQKYFITLLAMNGAHGLRPHNRRFYFNSFTNEFEPIYYDGDLRLDLDSKDFSGHFKVDNELLQNAFTKKFKETYENSFKKIYGLNKVLLNFQNRILIDNEEANFFFKIAISNTKNNISKLLDKLKKSKSIELKRSSFTKNINSYLNNQKLFGLKQTVISSLRNLNGNYSGLSLDGVKINLNQNQIGTILSKNNFNQKRTIYISEVNNDIDLEKELKFFENFDGEIFHSKGLKVSVDGFSKKIIFYQTNPSDWVLIKNANLSGWNVSFFGIKNKNLNVQKKDQSFNFSGMTGCLNLYNTLFDKTLISVNKANCEDGANIVNSFGNIKKIHVKDVSSDALDIDFSSVNIDHIEVSNAGNDCVDVSGGLYKFKIVNLINCGDKGVSIGEKSELKINKLLVEIAEIGLSSKDLSLTNVIAAQFKKVKYCFEAVQKKQEFGGTRLKFGYIDCKKGYIIDKNSIKLIGTK